VEIRAVIRDQASAPRWIRTIFNFGYAFIGECREELEGQRIASRYRLLQSAAEYQLFEGENLVGRDAGATIVIEARGISRRHAVFFVEGDQILIEDLASKNGTFVEEERVRGRVPLRDGSVIRLGYLSLSIRAVTTNETTLTEL
jgi:pSer/pThr/pTyr-binding forkhead associated (FHA) protein